MIGAMRNACRLVVRLVTRLVGYGVTAFRAKPRALRQRCATMRARNCFFPLGAAFGTKFSVKRRAAIFTSVHFLPPCKIIHHHYIPSPPPVKRLERIADVLSILFSVTKKTRRTLSSYGTFVSYYPSNVFHIYSFTTICRKMLDKRQHVV